MLKRISPVVVLAAVFSGCALTDYPVITDEDQVRQDVGTHVVNTAGEAHILEKSRVATIEADRTYEAIWFVNQDQDGDQTIYTKMNHGDPAEPDSWFHDDVFMNTNSNVCWNVRADNPATGDTDIFDADVNEQCDGEALIFLSKGDRTQEAGRDGNNGQPYDEGGSGQSQTFAGVTLQQAIDALGQFDAYATYGTWADYDMTGWKMVVSPDNFGIALANGAGEQTTFALEGVTVVFDLANRELAFDTRGASNLAAIYDQLADWIDANGQSASGLLTFAGTTATLDVGFLSADVYRERAEAYR